MSGVLGGLAVPGSPDEVGALSRELRRIADHVTDCKDQLSAAAGNVDWTGGAADAYRDKLGSLPDELEKVRVSYGEVSWALWSYEGSLRDLQARSNRAATRARDAQYRLDLVARTKRSGHHDPRLDAEEHAAHAQLSAARREAGNVYGAFQDAAATCCKRILHAGRAGMHNSFGSAFERYVVRDAGGFLLNVALAVPRAVVDLPKAAVDFWEHPSLESFSRLLQDVTAVVGVVAILYPPLGLAVLALSAVQVGTDVARGDWKAAALDSVVLGAGAVGRVATSGGIVGQRAATLQVERAAKLNAGSRHVALADDFRALYGTRAASGMRPVRWAARSGAVEYDLGSRYSLLRAGARAPVRADWAARQELIERIRMGPIKGSADWWHDYTHWTPDAARLPLAQGRAATVHYHHVGFVAGKVEDAVDTYQAGVEAKDLDNPYGRDRP